MNPLILLSWAEAVPENLRIINAIRNVTRKDVGYAPTGSKETTQNPTKYEHPNFKTISLWDMPGIGGKEWDTERYKEEICLKKYDALINQEFLEITGKEFVLYTKLYVIDSLKPEMYDFQELEQNQRLTS